MAEVTVVPAAPENTQWGYFEAVRPPVLAVESGARVRIETVSGAPAVTPESGYTVLAAQRAIHEQVERRQTPGHILTGPVAVKGAMPGDVLEIRLSPGAHLDPERLRTALPRAPQALSLENGTLRIVALHALELVPALLAAIQAGGARVEDLALRRKTLEDVFIALTGRSLRE